MKVPNQKYKLSTCLALLISFVILGFAGCTTNPRNMGRAELWQQNCMRCHNLRPADEFSDAEWEIIMLQMRTHTHLPAYESKMILEFLQQSN
jgi:hypothetical protein